jgi:4-hydroxy-3-methylbut-2-enyl diphosphate reductase
LQNLEILVANPRGFCAGVDRAISTVNDAIEKYPSKKIFVFHEIVHNKRVLNDFTKKGVVFVEAISDVYDDSVLIFSAHGVSKKIETQAKLKNLILIDATCPLVKKVHNEIVEYEKDNKEIIIIGNKNHPEVIGTIGRINSHVHIIEKIGDIKQLKVSNEENLAYITQTTLSVDYTKEIVQELQKKFPNISAHALKDICYATQNRQDAVKALVENVDMMLIVGSENSSNSKNLNKVAKEKNKNSYLIDSYKDINLKWFNNVTKIGISSGASAPDILIKEIIEFLKENFNNISVSDFNFKEEKVKFKLPTI